MACRNDECESYDREQIKEELNLTTRLLCDICKCDAVKEYVLHEFNDLRLWWNKHWKMDLERQEKEKELKERQKTSLRKQIQELEKKLKDL